VESRNERWDVFEMFVDTEQNWLARRDVVFVCAYRRLLIIACNKRQVKLAIACVHSRNWITKFNLRPAWIMKTAVLFGWMVGHALDTFAFWKKVII
jgi:hypothetical protein